jgi:chromate transporter
MPEPSGRLSEIGWLFLRLGATSFGGPAVHVAMMEEEIVRKRRWVTGARFLDLVAATNLIPGPNSTELALHLGRERGGWSGFFLAGGAFILPAMAITTALAWAYRRWGAVPDVAALLYGLKAAVVAIVAHALVRLAPGAAKRRPLALLGVASGMAAALGVHELLVLLAAGLLAAGMRGGGSGQARGLALPVAVLGAGGAAATAASAVSLPSLFGLFLKIGSVLFGSGYVLLAFLRADLVERLGWMTEAELLDAVSAGQMTPGPVFTTATFIGYLLQGPPGALVATLGIFLPAFVFVAVSGPLVPRLRASPVAAAFLDGVVVASLALMTVVTFQLGRAAIVDLPTALVAGVSLAVLLRTRVASPWLLVAGAVAGWVCRAYL